MLKLCGTMRVVKQIVDKYVLKGICIEDLSESIRQSMCSYLGSKHYSTGQDLERQATSQTELKISSRNINAPRDYEITEIWEVMDAKVPTEMILRRIRRC